MPTYEYRCQKCHKMFDAVQSMKDPHFKTCPETLCQNEGGWGEGEVTRLMGTGAGLIFKGSGFYITDYRSENYKESAKKDAPPTAGDKGGSGGGEKGSAEKSPATPAPAKAKGGESSSSSASGNTGSSSSSTPSAGSSPAASGPKT